MLKAASKVFLLVLSVCFLAGGWLGLSYTKFGMEFDKAVSAKDFVKAGSLVGVWEKTRAWQFLKNIPEAKQSVVFKQGWLQAQLGADEEAIREFRKAAGQSLTGADAAYNAATISFSRLGHESLERLAKEYIGVLRIKPDDFQAKVNLEIIRILQNQAKMGMPSPGEGEKEQKGKIKKYRPGDREAPGVSEPADSGIRY